MPTSFMEIFIILCLGAVFILTGLSIAILGRVLVDTSSGQIRRAPLVIGILAGILTAASGLFTANLIPGMIRFLILPIVMAALTTVLCLRKSDWEMFGVRRESVGTRYFRFRDICIVLAGILGAVCGGYSFIGRPILRGLGQDVVGTLPGEKIEIRIAGAVFGFLMGSIATAVLWAVIGRR